MNVRPVARTALLILQAFVALTALAGGTVLVVAALSPNLRTVLAPPDRYLHGSPFSSYLFPGLILAAVLGGTHAVAFVLTLREHRWDAAASAVAGFATLIWIFVQMVFIPFSVLQAAYFILGVAETACIMLLLGILAPSAGRDGRRPDPKGI